MNSFSIAIGIMKLLMLNLLMMRKFLIKQYLILFSQQQVHRKGKVLKMWLADMAEILCFLQWSNNILPPYLMSAKHPEELLHRNLKERIYYDIISYFDQGKVRLETVQHCLPYPILHRTLCFSISSNPLHHLISLPISIFPSPRCVPVPLPGQLVRNYFALGSDPLNSHLTVLRDYGYMCASFLWEWCQGENYSRYVFVCMYQNT